MMFVKKSTFLLLSNDPGYFEISNITGEIVKYPVRPVVRYDPVAYEWEIQAAFLAAKTQLNKS